MCFTWFSNVLRKPDVLRGFWKARVLHGFLRLLLRKPYVLRGFLACLGNVVFYMVSGKHVFYMVS